VLSISTLLATYRHRRRRLVCPFPLGEVTHQRAARYREAVSTIASFVGATTAEHVD